MADLADVVVIGGGVIGCSAAYELAKAGMKVTLLERGTIGCEASAASAGLLVPMHVIEEGERNQLFDFYWASSKLFPDLVADLESSTGMQLDYDPSGSIRVATDEDEEEMLRQAFEGWKRVEELSVTWAEAEDLREIEPRLGPEVRCGVVSEDEQSIHPGRLTESLARAAIAQGANIRTGCPVHSVRHQDGRFESVLTSDGEVAGGELLIATGAWSRVVCGWFGLDVPISPVRGQMLSIRPESRALNRPIFCPDGGVFPKRDGTMFVGATIELVGFDKRNTPEGIGSLLPLIPKLIPGFNGATLERCWAGLRPLCEDESPVIGRLTGCERVTIASGHYKMGIIGSAITARTIRQQIVEGRVDPLAASFSPDRFA